MFWIDDTLEERQEKIRSYLNQEPVISVLLAVAGFEWTVRRAILALGTNPAKIIRKETLEHCHGTDGYKKAWKKEVKPLVGLGLPDIIKQKQWDFFSTKAYPLRHRLIHGVSGTTGLEYAKIRVDSILNASRAVAEFASSKGKPVYGKKIVRRKSR